MNPIFIFLSILIIILFMTLKLKNKNYNNLENFQNKNFKVNDLCKQYKNKKIDYIIPGGNKGDGLIYEGLKKYFKTYNIQTNILNNNNFTKQNNILFIAGGGAFSKAFHKGNHYKPNLINKYNEVWILPSSFDISVIPVIDFLNKLNYNNIKIFARELKSYHDLQKVYKGKVFLDDDTAFNLDFSKYKIKGSGVIYAIRQDSENNKNINDYFKNKKINDLSKGPHQNWKELLEEISKYEEVHTNRAHISIAATLMGKKTYVYPSNYFKQKEIFKYSLQKYKNSHFVDI